MADTKPGALGEAAEQTDAGIAASERGDYRAAAAHFRAALAQRPGQALAHYNLATALGALGETDAALAHYRQAVALAPGLARAHYNLGNLLLQRERSDEALAAYRAAAASDPRHARAHNNIGNILLARGKAQEAAAHYEAAAAAEPGYADAQVNLGHALIELGRIDEAIAAYERALAMASSSRAALAPLVHALQQICAWPRWRALLPELVRAVEQGEPVSPFTLLSLPVSPALQRRAAERFTHAHFGNSGAAAPARSAATHEGRLRIGYISGDFRNHPTAYLTVEALEQHDRARFEIFAYSYGPDDGSALRARVARACDSFVDLRALSNRDAARRIEADRIAILIDRKGYTREARSQIVALRPAPVQASWIGYPGTMAAPFIDYIIADGFVIPPGAESGFGEHVVRLPGTYMCSDRQRVVAEPAPRAEHGLPEHGVVFCCFNQAFKILPDTFAGWMRVLAAVPGSVLWLFEKNTLASANLRREAEAAGIDPRRLVFARRLPNAEHLARYRIADLALDTFPYGSHTTANDALWAGCPLLARAGDTFASRVSGSLLHAAGMAELITYSDAEFERQAVTLAHDQPGLARLRARVAQARGHSPLFDTASLVRSLEAAYRAMWQLHLSGTPPAHIELRRRPSGPRADL
jgi:predicted O-linked N-acetylglucosamine transferase (SPINDLY family)